jgi:hypothetical protein
METQLHICSITVQELVHAAIVSATPPRPKCRRKLAHYSNPWSIAWLKYISCCITTIAPNILFRRYGLTSTVVVWLRIKSDSSHSVSYSRQLYVLDAVLNLFLNLENIPGCDSGFLASRWDLNTAWRWDGVLEKNQVSTVTGFWAPEAKG